MPRQIVISGTLKGIEAATLIAKSYNAKRVLPLQVHGAFHSGLMKRAQKKLTPFIRNATIVKGSSQLIMNVSGDYVTDIEIARSQLIEQVTRSVRWEQGVRAMDKQEINLYIEFGPGKTLAGMNKHIGVRAPTFSIDKVEDLGQLAQLNRSGEFL